MALFAPELLPPGGHDSTLRRPPTNYFPCCYALAGQPLPASSNLASRPQPTDLRPDLTGFTKSNMTATASWRAGTPPATTVDADTIGHRAIRSSAKR